jgi:redox-sensitive bicupin YhaK (pirin superfamily)
MRYADSTGKAGALGAGSLEWMRAGAGVWHAGGPLAGQPARGYQLWLALGPDLELGRAESRYVRPDEVPQAGPARVVLGAYAGERSPIPFETALVLHVRLANGERWRFEPPPGHDVAWLSVNAGRVHAGDVVLERELAVFADGEEAVEILAEGPVELILGSAPKHPHPLVEGHYSVHTSRAALAEGERVIETLRRTPAVAALRRGT